jgi:hypothetical protein
MADRTATDEARDLLRDVVEFYDLDEFFVGDNVLNDMLDALPAGLLLRLAAEKTGGPLFEGTIAELGRQMTLAPPTYDAHRRRIVVYPAPEETT